MNEERAFIIFNNPENFRRRTPFAAAIPYLQEHIQAKPPAHLADSPHESNYLIFRRFLNWNTMTVTDQVYFFKGQFS